MGDLRRDLDSCHKVSHFGKRQAKTAAWASKLEDSSGNSEYATNSKAMLGHFEHFGFKEKSNWILDNTPMMVDCFISVNELSLSKTKLPRPLKQNISRMERRAIEELSDNRNIIMNKADKGSCVVIMNCRGLS